MFKPSPFTKFRRRILPQTLLGRALLIIVMPLLLLQIVSAFVFFDNHWDRLSWRLSTSLAGEIDSVLFDLEEGQHSQDDIFTRARKNFGFRDIDFQEGEILPNQPRPDYNQVGEMMEYALQRRISQPFIIDDSDYLNQVIIDIQTPDGVLKFTIPGNRLFSSSTYVFLLWMIGSSLIFFGIAAMFMRNQIRPLRRLTHAVDRFGRGHDAALLQRQEEEAASYHRPQGAKEIRQSARAFNLMSERVRRLMRSRTAMLSGISHDLRTPLTRLGLQLDFIEDETLKGQMRQNLKEMQDMIESYLTFARGQDAEKSEMVDLEALCAMLTEKWQSEDFTLDCHSESQITYLAKPLALQRLFDNLIGNARNFASHVRLKIGRREDSHGKIIEILVDDNGPGIPEEEYERVFLPFVRLDESRSHQTGNSGLGLSIARDIVNAHGGQIDLDKSPFDGLRVRVRLPY